MNIEGFEIYDNSSDENAVEEHSTETPYLTTLFKKEGIGRIKNGKHFYQLPLKDLKEPPRFGNLYTVGDLIVFLKKHNYLLEFDANVKK